MWVSADTPSWQDEHTADIGEILRLSAELVAETPVSTVVPRIPLAVGAAQIPVSWYEVAVWQLVQMFSFPPKTTVLKSFAVPSAP